MLHLSTMIILMFFVCLFIFFFGFFKIEVITPSSRVDSSPTYISIAIEFRSSSSIFYLIKLLTFNRILPTIFALEFHLFFLLVFFKG